MESRKKLTKKQWLLYLVVLALCIAAILISYLLTNDRRKFKELTEDIFYSELSSDTLSLHYTLAYPENYDFHTDATLPCYQAGTADGSPGIQNSLDRLSEISPDSLSEEDAFAYHLLKRYLELRLIGESFVYYDEPLSPSSGMQSGLPILLADYTFRSEKDVEDYLDLLDQTDTYFEGLTLYEQEKAAAGLFMADYSAKKVVEQCDAIMDKEALSSGTHFLHETFEERVSSLEEEGVITAHQKAQYISENDRLLTTVMQPAYEALGDAFILLDGSGINEMGLCYYPDGKAYYEYLLAYSTGSGRSVSEIKQLLYEDFKFNYAALIALIQKYPELTAYASAAEGLLSFETPGEMLDDLQNRMAEDFPGLPKSDTQFTPSCTVKRVSPSMENYSSPAYYLTPPIDDMSNNTIYINHKNMPDSLTLYTTLAHEGYPGHLYQTVYSQLYMNGQEASCIRNLLHYGGYVEGWALYVENLSYEYAKQLVKDDTLATAWYEACRLNRNVQLCMYSLLDIAIHYEGAMPQEVQKILGRIGVTSPETANAVYQYIVEEPTNYPKYYVGYLEFLELQEDARNLWSDTFTLQNFHKFVLETGPCDFTTLSEQLTGYSSSASISSR